MRKFYGMTILHEIDHFFAHLRSPWRSVNRNFSTCRLENSFKGPFTRPGSSIRTLFYMIAIIENDSFEFSVNDSSRLLTRPYTMLFVSPYHLFHLQQRSEAKGQCICFTESFILNACQNSRFYYDFPLFWSNKSFCFLDADNAAILLQLGQKIIDESEKNSPYSHNIIGDYLHILLLEFTRIAAPRNIIEDNSPDYQLLQQFYKLIKTTYPIIRSVEEAAGILSVTPARLWLVTKKLADETPSEIINRRILTEAKSLLIHSHLTISEIGFHLQFKEKSHFTRFFKNLTGIPPVEYVRQFRRMP